jgi:hypothetical protein
MARSTTPKSYWQSLKDPKFAPTALRVALVIGSLLFIINHGAALGQRQMTRQRWLSGLLTYLVPYCVSIHGQYTNQSKRDCKRD